MEADFTVLVRREEKKRQNTLPCVVLKLKVPSYNHIYLQQYMFSFSFLQQVLCSTLSSSYWEEDENTAAVRRSHREE